MGTLAGRPRSALLVVDVQVGVVASAHRRDEVVAAISRLVAAARGAGTPVVWVQHHDDELAEGSPEWRIVPELVPADGEAVVHKAWNDAFEETDLEERLAERAVGRLVVVGAQTEWCIRATLHGAIARGYDATLVEDAHTTGDLSPEVPATAVIAMTNAYWTWHAVPGRSAGTCTASEVAFP